MFSIEEFHNAWVKKIRRDDQQDENKYFITLSSIEEIQYATELKDRDHLPSFMKIEDGKVMVNVLTAPFNRLPFFWREGIEKIGELLNAINLLYDGRCINEKGTPAYPSNIKYGSVNIPKFSDKNMQVLSMYCGEDHDYVKFAQYYMEKPKEEERTM